MLDKLHEGLPLRSIDTEAQYYQLWSEQVRGEDDPFSLAISGGLLASSFGFIFSAGYQAALRKIFPQAEFSGWVAFAVSEDRTPENPLPGVVYTPTTDGFVLQGYKTWVAASDHCTSLIVSARGEDGTKYFQVSASDAAVGIITKPVGRMLPDLSQGKAHLDGVSVETDLDAKSVKHFAPAEVFYIYSAFLASTWARFELRREEVERLLAEAEVLSRRTLPAWDEDQLRFDAGVQHLLTDMRKNEGEQDALWRRDYKLIAMYSKQTPANPED